MSNAPSWRAQETSTALPRKVHHPSCFPASHATTWQSPELSPKADVPTPHTVYTPLCIMFSVVHNPDAFLKGIVRLRRFVCYSRLWNKIVYTHRHTGYMSTLWVELSPWLNCHLPSQEAPNRVKQQILKRFQYLFTRCLVAPRSWYKDPLSISLQVIQRFLSKVSSLPSSLYLPAVTTHVTLKSPIAGNKCLLNKRKLNDYMNLKHVLCSDHKWIKRVWPP